MCRTKRGEDPYRTVQVSDLLYGCVGKPLQFSPLEVPLPSGEKALFQDGVLCVGSNPTLYLFLLATNPSFAFRWRTGERWLQIFSIGTGQAKRGRLFKNAADVRLLTIASNMPTIQIGGANELNRLLLQKIATKESSEREFERMPFSRQRYDVRLDADTMVALGLNDLTDVDSWATKPIEERLFNSSVFSRVGEHAKSYIQDGDFLRTFDVRKPVKVD